MLKKRLVGIVTQKENRFLYRIGELEYDNNMKLIPQLFEIPMINLVLFSDKIGDMSLTDIKKKWENEDKFTTYLFTREEGKIKRLIEYCI